MKKIIIVLIVVFYCITAFAQADTTKTAGITDNNYWLLKNFLTLQKNNPAIFTNRINPQWNSKLYQDQYQQALAINKKKELYPVLQFDSRFISQSYPSRYGSQNYMWVSTTPEYRNLGEQVTSDIIGGVVGGLLSSKKHRFNTTNNKGYYTPAGLKY